MKKLNIIMALFVSAQALSANEKDEDYLAYSMPKEVDVYGPSVQWGGGRIIEYYLKGSDRSNFNNCVASDEFRNDVLVARKLYRKGKQHGVQKTWHQNGKLKTEAPYLDGTMHGVFKHWNDAGELIGKYNMKEGKGSALVFHNNGVLKLRESYMQSKKQGLCMKFAENSMMSYWIKYNKGKMIGVTFSFFPTDDIESIIVFSDKGGELHGPAIYYSENGGVNIWKYYLHGEEASKHAYITARKKDPTLPYFEDVQKYKTLLTNNIKREIKVYKALEPVKIPLEFDRLGNPLSKENKPVVLPDLSMGISR